MPSRQSAKIFISYAKEDAAAARRLRDDLERHGHRPWLDSHELLGGQQWELAIREALRGSDLVVIVLSGNSVNKRGYVQREIRLALDLWQERLESDIFLIPVRLQDCPAPERLRQFQWVDLFEPDGFSRLLRSITAALDKLSPGSPPGLPYALDSVEITEKTQERHRDVQVSYPRMTPSEALGAKACNALFEKVARRWLGEFSGDVSSSQLDASLLEEGLPEDLLHVDWTPTLQTPAILSIRFHIYRHMRGGVHGGACCEHLNLLLNPFRHLSLDDIFASAGAGMSFLRGWSKHELAKQSLADFGEVPDIDWIERGTSEPHTFGFNLGDRALLLYFDEYQVGPYVWGGRHVEVPYAALLHLARRSGPFAELLQSQELTARGR